MFIILVYIIMYLIILLYEISVNDKIHKNRNKHFKGKQLEQQ